MVILSRPRLSGHAHNHAEKHAGIGVGWGGGAAGLDHFRGVGEEFGNVDAHDGGGNHAEIGKRGVAPANGRVTVEDVAELVSLRLLLQLGAGIGDRDEAAAGFFGADGLLHAIKEILLEDVRF